MSQLTKITIFQYLRVLFRDLGCRAVCVCAMQSDDDGMEMSDQKIAMSVHVVVVVVELLY